MLRSIISLLKKIGRLFHNIKCTLPFQNFDGTNREKRKRIHGVLIEEKRIVVPLCWYS